MKQKQYQIMIKASGPHHEGHATGNRSRDADFLLSEFLEKMRASGQEVTVASFSADNTTQMLIGSPRDINTLDELYGISSNTVEDETAEDTNAVTMTDLLNEIQGLREEHAHTHQKLVSFIDYEKDEDSDDPKAAKKRKPRGKKNEEGGAPSPEIITPAAADAASPQEGATGASALTSDPEVKPADEPAQEPDLNAEPSDIPA